MSDSSEASHEAKVSAAFAQVAAPHVIAQLSDLHLGGRNEGSGERFSQAVDEINSMTRQPDLVLLTGDLTETGSTEEWDEFNERIAALNAPWEAITGNHDRPIQELRGHRAMDTGPLRLLLLDTSDDVFTDDDATWLEGELASTTKPTVVAIHQPPFETGIWWMDCVGLTGGDRLEAVVRRHRHTILILSGHVHRQIHTNWGSCSIFACPSTSVSVAGDLDPAHDPAETAEPPMIGLHAITNRSVITHVIPVGPAAQRFSIAESSAEFVAWARGQQAKRDSLFS